MMGYVFNKRTDKGRLRRVGEEGPGDLVQDRPSPSNGLRPVRPRVLHLVQDGLEPPESAQTGVRRIVAACDGTGAVAAA